MEYVHYCFFNPPPSSFYLAVADNLLHFMEKRLHKHICNAEFIACARNQAYKNNKHVDGIVLCTIIRVVFYTTIVISGQLVQYVSVLMVA